VNRHVFSDCESAPSDVTDQPQQAASLSSKQAAVPEPVDEASTSTSQWPVSMRMENNTLYGIIDHACTWRIAATTLPVPNSVRSH